MQRLVSAAAPGNQRHLAGLDLFAAHEAEVAIEYDDVGVASREAGETLVQHRSDAVHEFFHGLLRGEARAASLGNAACAPSGEMIAGPATSLPSIAAPAPASPSSYRRVACSSSDRANRGREARSRATASRRSCCPARDRDAHADRPP